LCQTNLSKLKWLVRKAIPLEMFNEFSNKQNNITLDDNKTCNTDKEAVFTCPMKCKIRGVELACTNCGIVVGFRELFLSESLTQVATFFLDLYDQYECIYNFYKLIYLLFNSEYIYPTRRTQTLNSGI
jgi:hypothetical protein